jgi:hypothetical protein
MMGRIQQWSKRFGMRRTAREMAIESSGGTFYYTEYNWKSKNSAA